MVRKPGNRHGAWHRAESEHDLSPGDGLRAAFRFDRGRPRDQVDGFQVAEQELRVRAHHAQRHDGVPRLERA